MTQHVRHVLRTWPEQFAAVASGAKRHEVRAHDRDFKVGDELLLQEWDPSTERYSGHARVVTVTHITAGGAFGLPSNLCVMSIELLPTERPILSPRPAPIVSERRAIPDCTYNGCMGCGECRPLPPDYIHPWDRY